jgi:F0F1-type ATP synthase membrane subunit c/vacuolar-type H+-ATPase subunit K
MTNAISVAMTIPTISLRCVASVDVAVEAIDSGIMQGYTAERAAQAAQRRASAREIITNAGKCCALTAPVRASA